MATTTHATPYTFTEKMRIRKSFAKRASVLQVPFLLETQLASYRAFLQDRTPGMDRKNEGLQAAFTSIFPISSHSGNARLEFVSFSLLPPAFDVVECQQRGLTYCSALRAKVRLVIMDREAPKDTIKEVKEQEVYMGEMPLMTENGSFIINGTERVIVSQLHRSPGVFFEHDRGKTHSSGKLLFSARVIPYRGSWLDFEFDPKDFLFFRVDRRRKMPVTTLLKAIGLTNEDILRAVLRVRHVPPGAARAPSSSSCRSGCAAKWRASTSTARTARSSSPKDKRITARHVRELSDSGVKRIAVPTDYVLGRSLATNVVDKSTGEMLAKANDEVTEELLEKLSAAGIKRDQDDLHERPRHGSVHLADAAHRRHAGPVRGQGRDLPDDASRRAADRRRRRGAVPRPVLRRGALRPVGRRPDEVQPPRRPRQS